MYKEERNKIYIPIHFGFIIDDAHHISHCVAEGSYTWVYFDNRDPVLATRRLSVIQKLLKEFYFIRCHKSFLVNTSHIKEFCAQGKNVLILQSGVTLKVSCRKLRKLKVELQRSFATIPA
jgi:two-component system, LytTR family, response regulator